MDCFFLVGGGTDVVSKRRVLLDLDDTSPVTAWILVD